jgi:hypothetical protein
MNTWNIVLAALTVSLPLSAKAQAATHYEQLADTPFDGGYPTLEGVAQLKNELLFQRAVQSYIWALPALNMYGMKEGSEKTFGAGYNVLPIWKDRLNAKTLVTTPNSDVIYAMGYLDSCRPSSPMAHGTRIADG